MCNDGEWQTSKEDRMLGFGRFKKKRKSEDYLEGTGEKYMKNLNL